MEATLVLQDCLTACDTHFGMGTLMAHQLHGAQAHACLAAAREELIRLEGLLSRFIPSSDVSHINRSAGRGSERVSADALAVLERARQAAERCGGCFDPTIGPLVDLWNIRGEDFALPDEPAIQAALALVDYRDLSVNDSAGTAGLRRAGQNLDLGGIGKGYAGDALMRLFGEYGVDSALSNLGGNVIARGCKPDGSLWQVGIRHPRREGTLIGALAVVDSAVVTSGDDQRYRVDSRGRRYHHLLDPRTGRPARSGLLSVTVAAESALDADVYSTALFVAGLERGLALLRGQPGIEAVFVDGDLRVFVTAGLAGDFQSSGNQVVIV
ncbi:MAG: FAD:protein FMN transferase [Anaerolineae bacterium]|nr:FAD:protein FMN transferase [Anaerolineae bacterium]